MKERNRKVNPDQRHQSSVMKLWVVPQLLMGKRSHVQFVGCLPTSSKTSKHTTFCLVVLRRFVSEFLHSSSSFLSFQACMCACVRAHARALSSLLEGFVTVWESCVLCFQIIQVTKMISRCCNIWGDLQIPPDVASWQMWLLLWSGSLALLCLTDCSCCPFPAGLLAVLLLHGSISSDHFEQPAAACVRWRIFAA